MQGITKGGVDRDFGNFRSINYKRYIKKEFGDLLGISDKAIQASEEKRTGPQRTTGGLLQFAGEIPGPATPIFLIGYSTKTFKTT